MNIDEFCENHVFQFMVMNKEYNKIKSIEKIHPQKQKEVFEILQNGNIESLVEELIVFGSSTNIKCNIESDIDIAVKLKDSSLENKRKISRYIGKITDWKYDIIWLDDNNASNLMDAIKKGVRVI